MLFYMEVVFLFYCAKLCYLFVFARNFSAFLENRQILQYETKNGVAVYGLFREPCKLTSVAQGLPMCSLASLLILRGVGTVAGGAG